MAISEKIELLGKYEEIPRILTLTSMPTATELDYVGAEDFDDVMLDKILPKSVEEGANINFRNLLEVDYLWICRALRILNYGPYHTTNSIFCDKCGTVSRGEYNVDLRTIPCNPIPDDFTGSIVISRDKFLDFGKSITIKLPTIQEKMNAFKDKMFKDVNGMTNRDLARLCYMMKSLDADQTITPVQAKIIIQDQMSPADYIIFKEEVHSSTNFGLRAGGSCVCPKCKHTDASFIAIQDDRFFRPTLGDLRKWRDDRNSREANTVQRSEEAAVRKNN